jgi:hypothetical protein
MDVCKLGNVGVGRVVSTDADGSRRVYILNQDVEQLETLQSARALDMRSPTMTRVFQAAHEDMPPSTHHSPPLPHQRGKPCLIDSTSLQSQVSATASAEILGLSNFAERIAASVDFCTRRLPFTP